MSLEADTVTTTNLPIYLDDTGTARTDSRSLAVLYSKRHDHVLRVSAR